MEISAILNHIQDALLCIDNPRFFETERGYQGQLLTELQKFLPSIAENVIFEQEHQKTLILHGIKNRPDIIIHEPFNPAHHKNRTEGNILVIELKRATTEKGAVEDFEALIKMMDILQYPCGVFINIDSAKTFAKAIPSSGRERIVCFSTELRHGKPIVFREVFEP